MLRTLSKVKSLKGKRVLVRVDFNVPIDKKGVSDDTRIRETLPTLKHLIKQGARVIVITHLGRPEGKVVEKLKLDAVAKSLSKLLKKKVQKLNACIGPKVEAAIDKMKNGEVMLLENIRFYPEEETCEAAFTKALASLGDVFVNDAFAACHRKHASVYGIAKKLPSYAGFLIEQEMKNLAPLLAKPKHPFTLIVGGAKIDTKIGLIKNFIGKADHIIIGGALANTFLAAQGFDVGGSLYEKEKIVVAQEILMLAEKKHQHISLPEDVVVASEATEYATHLDVPAEDVEGDMKIFDIGVKTQKKFAKIIGASKMVVWNGPLGLYEFTPFRGGTSAVAKATAKVTGKAQTVIGGGDTLDALTRCKVARKKFTFVSTGGGAMLEFLEGKKLPGIEVLMD
ncbi:phosphoglycerate kinase [Candidatus Gracilibacteria bacterium]|nr:phosphoglycerate kinase [Candidatus Gracilibacteria bacterium]